MMFQKILVLILVLLMHSVSAKDVGLYGENSKPYGENPEKYLMSKNFVFYAVKLAELPTRFDYKLYMEKVD